MCVPRSRQRRATSPSRLRTNTAPDRRSPGRGEPLRWSRCRQPEACGQSRWLARQGSARHRLRSPVSELARRRQPAASVLLLLKVQFVSQALGQFLEQLLELRPGGGGDFDGYFRDLGGRTDAPAFELANQVE